MTQKQIDLQNQPQKNTTDFLTQPLFNISPVRFFEASDQDQPTTNSEQIDHHNYLQMSAHLLKQLIIIHLLKHLHRRKTI